MLEQMYILYCFCTPIWCQKVIFQEKRHLGGDGDDMKTETLTVTKSIPKKRESQMNGWE